MSFNDRSANRQTHAHTVGLGGEEYVENSIGILLLYCWARFRIDIITLFDPTTTLDFTRSTFVRSSMVRIASAALVKVFKISCWSWLPRLPMNLRQQRYQFNSD
jgi:hypothetical protein